MHTHTDTELYLRGGGGGGRGRRKRGKEGERGRKGEGRERRMRGTHSGKVVAKVEIGPLQVEVAVSEALTSCSFIRTDSCQEQN